MAVLVAYASKHGSTAGIAERIAKVLGADGRDVVLRQVGSVDDVSGYDAYVVGSSIYAFHWSKDATTFVQRHRDAMAGRPVWLFSSGPLGTSTTDPKGRDAREFAGPKELDELREAVEPVDHRVFYGSLELEALSPGERAVRRLMPNGRELMPEGDYRDWDEIEEWAHGIDRGLRRHESEPAPAS